MARRNLSQHQPIKNIARTPPERTFYTEDGEEVREKLNPMRADMKKKMLDKAGNTYFLSLANGYSIRRQENLYGLQKLEEKIADGHLPMAECPIAKGHIEAEGAEPCSGVFTDEKPCKHILAIAKKRREAYEKKASDYVKHFKKNEDRIVNGLIEALKNVKAEPAATGKKGGLPVDRGA